MFCCWYSVRSLLIVAISVYLFGCMVGPNFKQPSPPTVKTYTEKTLPTKTASAASLGGKAQQYKYNLDIEANWWYLFQSKAINELVKTGIENNPSLVAAQAALKQAKEILRAEIGTALFPSINATTSGTKQSTSSAATGGNIPGNVFNLYNVSANVTYNLDLFGGSRREIESLQAQVDYQKFQLIATYLTLTANIVTTAISIASLEEQIQTTFDLIDIEQHQLNIMRQQFHLGGIANTNVLTQQTLVDQTRATLPPLEKSLSQSRHALAVLIGKYPNTLLPSIQLNKLNLPAEIPVTIPSKLVQQRPDIRAAEALLHSASAQIGVATANLFPQINLSAGFGWLGEAPSVLFNSNSKAWSLGGKLTQPIFQGGALLAQRRAAIDAYQQTLAQYRLVVLQAFQNVADALRALETDARTFKSDKAAETAAWETLKITQQQYNVGGVSYLNLLTVQQQYQQTRLNRIEAQATRYSDTVALYQALGGGWWNQKFNIEGRQ